MPERPVSLSTFWSHPLRSDQIPSVLVDLPGVRSLIGERPLPISGPQGEIIGYEKLDVLEQMWFSEHIDVEATFQVVHKVVKTSTPIADVFNKIISEVSQERVGKIKCLLDEHRKKGFPRWEWIIIGPRGLVVPGHRDMFDTDSWNYLIKGRKRWEFRIGGQEDQPSLVLELIQRAGDLVWIPTGCWHSVEYLEPSFAYSKNIIRADNVTRVRDRYGQRGDVLTTALQVLEVYYGRLHGFPE